MDPLTIVLAVISAIVTISCAILGAVLHRKTERIKIIEKQLSEKRYAAYTKLYDFFYEMLKGTKNGKGVANNNTMSNKLRDAKKELMMYGSDDVIFALNKYLSSISIEDTYSQLDYFLDLMVLIRKDMCGKTKVGRNDILLNLLQNKEELKRFNEYKLTR